MKAIISYPLPFDAWDTFRTFVHRFVWTFKQHPPGAPYELWAGCCWGQPTDEIRRLFYGIKVRFFEYYASGEDAGVYQQIVNAQSENALVVFMTSRCHFHRAGWLAKLVEAREKHGPAMYGMAANRETWPLHICGRGTTFDSHDFKFYPHRLDDKARDGQFFEVGKNNPDGTLLDWAERRGLPGKLVMFDGVYDKPDWFKPANRFRNGDQSNVLVWDKHTDIFANADEAEKARLIRMAEET